MISRQAGQPLALHLVLPLRLLLSQKTGGSHENVVSRDTVPAKHKLRSQTQISDTHQLLTMTIYVRTPPNQARWKR